jgi:hypothetical protein
MEFVKGYSMKFRSKAIIIGLALFQVVNAEPINNTMPKQSAQVAQHTVGNTSNLDNTSSDIQYNQPSNLNNLFNDNMMNRFHLHGFLSTGFSMSNVPEKYTVQGHGNINNKANFNTPTLVGLQLGVDITQKLSLVTQLVADGDDTDGKTPYTPTLNWMYASYDVNPYINVQAGRFQLPLFCEVPISLNELAKSIG